MKNQIEKKEADYRNTAIRIIGFILSLVIIPVHILVLYSVYNMYYTLVGFELPRLDWKNLLAISFIMSVFSSFSKIATTTSIYNTINESKTKEEKNEESAKITLRAILLCLFYWLFAYIFKIILF